MRLTALLLAAALLSTALLSPAHAQGRLFVDMHWMVPPGEDRTEALAVGDVDGDQSLDLLFGNAQQDRLYLNDGAGAFFDATANLPAETEWCQDLAVGDVDGDADLDALIGIVVIKQNHLYLNDGTGVFLDATGNLPPDADDTLAIALGDSGSATRLADRT